ncbi:hypothetical protein SAMN04488542_10947 [Fontibacillus panacisegetis]|uniref:HEPN domain-containing protein n=1 Tax=Fontibacillus panacisegetis TaxID=670482 RepID=A0A1G7K7I7_9BACL|nr:hypothetical protein SAMN04488542_10947 [Fontibacillus panacisegetis]
MVINEISVERMNILLKRPFGCNLAQTYMNLIPIFQNLPKPCLILSNWSLEIMLKAAFMKERGSIFPPHTLSFEMLVDLTRTDSGIDLDSLALIQSVKCIANYPNHTSLQSMSAAHLQRVIRRVDELLCQLSCRVTNSPTERYTSIFK